MLSVKLSTHHHLQSAQPLAPFELRLFIFIKASLAPLSVPLGPPLIRSGLCR